MGRWPRTFGHRAAIACIAAAAMTCLAGAAEAKPWAKWAPAPLASDSAYAALSARPADSLSVSELAWVTLQRDWRAQRDAEARGVSQASLSSDAILVHHPRRTDPQFAGLMSRPYASLSVDERTWLLLEGAAQRADRQRSSGATAAVGFATLAAIVGVVAGMALGIAAFAHAL